MTIFTKILTSAKIGKFCGKRYDYHREIQSFICYERHRTFPRSVNISAVFFFFFGTFWVCICCWVSYTTVLRHPLACLWRCPLLQRGVGENRPGVMQIYKFSFKKREGLSSGNLRSGLETCSIFRCFIIIAYLFVLIWR